MTPLEHERLLAGTLAAAGVATVGSLADSTYSFEDEAETQFLSKVMLFFVGLITGASLVMAWGT
jgi:hypothetical protein